MVMLKILQWLPTEIRKTIQLLHYSLWEPSWSGLCHCPPIHSVVATQILFISWRGEHTSNLGPLHLPFPFQNVFCSCTCFPPNLLVSSQISSPQGYHFLNISAKDAPFSWSTLIQLLFFFIALISTWNGFIYIVFISFFPSRVQFHESNLDSIITIFSASRTVSDT